LKIDELFNDQQRPPEEIAILLPVTGKYKSISEAILEGVFTGYYEHLHENPNQLINITIYNTSNANDSIWPIYNLAKKNKPGIILGPLQKIYVEQLLESSSLPIPVLTFNYASVERLDANQFDLIEFGLRPEDEATQIADLSATKNLLKSIAIVPRSNFGQRMLATYRKRLEHHGGTVVNQESYSRTQKDFSRSIKQLVGINKSQNRFRRLRNITGTKFEFEPRIRQDVDNIFVVANNKQGKLIIPQFKFFQVGKLPVFANSQIYKPNQKNDSDLNNVTFLAPPCRCKEAFSLLAKKPVHS
jgi:outer membrane PBP1 activator LpoA protein